MSFEMKPVGRVQTSRKDVEDDNWGGEVSCIELAEGLPQEALQGLDAFSHVEIVFVFDRVDPSKVVTGARHPRNNPLWPKVGIFAQRAKKRPNRIGTTHCRVVRLEGRRLYVAELDAVDGTPVLDIKPVLSELLPREEVRQPEWSVELMANYWRPKPGE